MNDALIRMTKENADEVGFFCCMSRRDSPGWTAKRAWLEELDRQDPADPAMRRPADEVRVDAACDAVTEGCWQSAGHPYRKWQGFTGRWCSWPNEGSLGTTRDCHASWSTCPPGSPRRSS